MPMLTDGGDYAIDLGGVQQLFFVRIAPNHGQPLVMIVHSGIAPHPFISHAGPWRAFLPFFVCRAIVTKDCGNAGLDGVGAEFAMREQVLHTAECVAEPGFFGVEIIGLAVAMAYVKGRQGGSGFALIQHPDGASIDLHKQPSRRAGQCANLHPALDGAYHFPPLQRVGVEAPGAAWRDGEAISVAHAAYQLFMPACSRATTAAMCSVV